MPEKKNKKKTQKKNQKEKNNNPLSFKGLPFEEILSDLLKVKPKPKENARKKEKATG
jgi:hypothetical protein